ncbi:MAG: aminotransferase class V-fold PLP-dependent enzyme [Parcubacteria group bacterium]|nr:aminotransferase class V-fold PLP-dependent enzyme [Parcubacteria group bacterium]
MHKNDFPIFKNNKDLVYLDNAATAQKPRVVIDAMNNFYTHDNANVHRGFYGLGEKADALYEDARKTFAKFINAQQEEIVFTKNATEGLNLVAHAWGRTQCKEGDEIVVSLIEHHSNFIPWQLLAKERKLTLRFWKPDRFGVLHIKDLEGLIISRTKAICITYVSNVLGYVVPVEKIKESIGKKNIALIVDAAQAVPHIPVDVQHLQCDFLSFSVHKMYGPTGLGILYIKESRLCEMKPFMVGGGMATEVGLTHAKYLPSSHVFEAGTPPIAEVVGGAEAVRCVTRIGFDAIQKHEHALVEEIFRRFETYSFARVLSPREGNIGVVAFDIQGVHPVRSREGSQRVFASNGIHPHDAASLFAERGVALRAGHHCAMPLHTFLKVPASLRISLGLYNDEKDIDAFFEALNDIKKIFSL